MVAARAFIFGEGRSDDVWRVYKSGIVKMGGMVFWK